MSAGRRMTRTRTSLFYPATYLLGGGLNLLVAPKLALALMLSNGSYGEAMPRMAGALMFGLGLVVVQVIRHEVEALYATLVGVRVFFCAVWLALYAGSRDPFFLVVFGIVAAGMVWTAIAHRLDAPGAARTG